MGRRRKGEPVHGWVILNKPEGISSTQAVGKVRRHFNAQKAGHAGTLDPLASGVLPIALGEATKTVPYVMADRKTYTFTVKWGEATTTDDREGDAIETSDVRPSQAGIEAALSGFLGALEQRPPAFSAIKVDGQRAYDLARKGEAPDLPARTVHVEAFELVGRPSEDEACFSVTCGKGTYVRSLGRDLARKLGTCGHVTALHRSQVGSFSAENAIPLDNLLQVGYRSPSCEHLLPIMTALDDISALAVTEIDAQHLHHGRAIHLTPDQMATVGGVATAYAHMGSYLIAIGDVKAAMFHPTRVFNLPLKEDKTDVDYC